MTRFTPGLGITQVTRTLVTTVLVHRAPIACPNEERASEAPTGGIERHTLHARNVTDRRHIANHAGDVSPQRSAGK